MSRHKILRALEQHGPLPASRLADICCLPSGQIARTTLVLRAHGRVIRVDGGAGRGSVAVYALPGTTTRVTAKAERDRHRVTSAADPKHPGSASPRDPCWRCGTRGDLGCKHQAAAPCR